MHSCMQVLINGRSRTSRAEQSRCSSIDAPPDRMGPLEILLGCRPPRVHRPHPNASPAKRRRRRTLARPRARNLPPYLATAHVRTHVAARHLLIFYLRLNSRSIHGGGVIMARAVVREYYGFVPSSISAVDRAVNTSIYTSVDMRRRLAWRRLEFSSSTASSRGSVDPSSLAAMEFGRRKSFSFFEEDRKARPGARTPVHQYYARAAAGGARSPAREAAEPARLSMSSVPGVEVPLPPSMMGGGGGGGGCSPWVQSPLHARLRFPPSPAAIYHCLAALHRLDGDVHALAVARGVLFTASDSGRVRAWAAPGCFNRGYLDVGRGRVPALAACGGTLVTSHSRDHHVRVWTVCAAAACDHIRAKKAATLPAKGGLSLLPFGKRRPHHHRDTVSCLVLHAVAGLLYTGSHDHTVKAWKLSDGSCVDSFVAHDAPVNAMVVNEADGCVFTASADGTVKMWRRVYGGTTHALIIVLRSELYSPVNALALCHAASSAATRRCFLYAGSSDGYVNVWEKEATAGRPVHAGFLKGHRLAVFCLASGCGGRVVVSGSEDATMRVWRREGKGGGAAHTCLAVIEGHRGPVRCLAVGGGEAGEVEGSMVVYSAGLDKSVKVWRIRVVGKEEEDEDDDDDDDDGVDDMAPEADILAAGKVDGDAALRDDDVEENEEELVGPTPVLSPVWVEKRRHTSRG
ncbi:hypothetical protein ACP70R_030849 [Stipagrostis hirtigluma subsp. patula]